uniref:IPT/TIG domain-containing protein n=1 Tax=Candidatus Methanogaster sp. ANME-2c ERB4 TaxID=2759911 RepID=A0A7G9YRS1_9EURY|nr:hypothetical protein HLBKPKBF_00023 [Methanosarcinales archaeon ANME-2c ERB4]
MFCDDKRTGYFNSPKVRILTIAVAGLAIVGIAIAAIPPPPANQDLGIYDTVCGEFAEEDCRACHSSGIPDAHHLLVQNEGYECTDCHPVQTDSDGNTGVEVIRDCVVCHEASPHHGAPDAVARHCSHCHGSYVDDYDDGHSIPTYNPSLITPDTSFRAKDNATGKKWGGCEACHEPDEAVPAIYSNPETHHNLGNLSLECDICHGDSEVDLLNIRKCEECHGVRSLHNIQYDYTGTKGQLGFGHVGDNWDCTGCHAWYVAYSDAPQTGPIIPGIDQVSPARMVAGEVTVVNVTGTNFLNTVGGVNYTSDVVIDTGEETITLTPDFITDSEIVVTVPALDSGRYGLYVVKSEMRSKLVAITVAPPVAIDSATINGDNVVTSGAGFSEYDSAYREYLGVTVESGTGAAVDCAIGSWSDTRIMITCPDARTGDLAIVDALYGSDSAELSISIPASPHT